MTTMIYEASPVKPASTRERRTRAELSDLCDGLKRILEEDQPMTVRQVYYRAVVAGLVDKTHKAYEAVGRSLLKMRRENAIPYGWIEDSTRWMRRAAVHSDLSSFIDRHQLTYRRDLWAGLDEYVEVWCEKEALAGIIDDVTREYAVPLMVSRGFASESYLYEAADSIRDELVYGNRSRAIIYYFGDYDPSGLKIGESIEAGLRRMCRYMMPTYQDILEANPILNDPTVPFPDMDIPFDDDMLIFNRVAVTLEQIQTMRLPSRPTKEDRNKHAIGWDPEQDSVDLDAIPPRELRGLVRDCIERHITDEHMAQVRLIEAEERKQLSIFGDALKRQPT